MQNNAFEIDVFALPLLLARSSSAQGSCFLHWPNVFNNADIIPGNWPAAEKVSANSELNLVFIFVLLKVNIRSRRPNLPFAYTHSVCEYQ